MTYHFSKILEMPFMSAIGRTKAVLKENGFGVLTEIDVKDTLKDKLDVDFRPYVILGACSPKHAYKAFQNEDRIGLMLPCNVVVQDRGEGKVEVSAIDPIASMMAVQNESLGEVATEVQGLMRKVIESL